MKSPSKIADNRKSGRHQAEQLRAAILDAAERLFLEKGIEHTSMADIAAGLGISRVTVYRYFANRDEVAVAIQARMLEKINAAPAMDRPATLDSYRAGVKFILRNFADLRDAFRFIGMFDAIYLDKSSEDGLARWTRAQLLKSGLSERAASQNAPQLRAYEQQLQIILNTFTWSLEKLALRGEFTWSEPPLALQEQLAFFEKMILGALDLLEQEHPHTPPPAPPL